ncbi:alanine racemase [Clostridium cavendishii DSM 21758]|uniref:Alanine racemase n=1 Tax=Clostridium cavendishii DSM 21758 TaxID=1121302 RepID=A0A1M6TTZ0_9CLOT|nr:alanine racemase [Clostridium cavendishii]SHK60384.1 alanine racemase [Clostridium cavendishii DSM 21758]
MNDNIRPVWAEIDLNAIAHNMKEIKRCVKSNEIIAVVKADAYGHGAVDVAPVLIENGAKRLAVAVITEAIELRNANITAPIMILGYTPLTFAEDIINNEIEQTVYNLEYAMELSKTAMKLGKKARIHIAIDTGMGRIGFMPNEESFNAVKKINSLEGIIIEGIFTHFSSSDEANKDYTYEQLEKFNKFNDKLLKENINIKLKHASNSAAIIDLPNTHLNAVRPGIILYGYYPSDEVIKENLSLKPALTLKTNVVHVKKMEKDMYISYGRAFKTEKESIIATLPIGYADGYTRLLTGKAKVIIKGKFAPVVGKICMDQLMIDVTDIEDVRIGDEVILIGGCDDISFNADDIAKLVGTINYEIICMLKNRVPRVYVKDGEFVKIRNYV